MSHAVKNFTLYTNQIKSFNFENSQALIEIIFFLKSRVICDAIIILVIIEIIFNQNRFLVLFRLDLD